MEVLRADESPNPKEVKALLDSAPDVVMEQDVSTKETPLCAYCAHLTLPLDKEVLDLLLNHNDRCHTALGLCDAKGQLPFQTYLLKTLTQEHPDAEITRMLLQVKSGPHCRSPEDAPRNPPPPHKNPSPTGPIPTR